MKLKQLRDDTRGSVIVEFSVTIVFFLVLMFGLVQGALLLYTNSGLQHGAEMAARCASVNYAAYRINLSESCFTSSITKVVKGVSVGVTPSDVVGDPTYIQEYAANNSWGIVPSSGSFNVDPPPAAGGTGKCGTSGGTPVPGYVVSVSHHYNLINFIFSTTLNATSCFPIS